MRPMSRLFSLAAFASFLAGCAGLGAPPHLVGSFPTALRVPAHTANLRVNVLVPNPPRGADVRPAYVSAFARAMKVEFAGPTRVDETFALTGRSRNCKRISRGLFCSNILALLPCPTAANCYRGEIATYDKVRCTPSGCAVPPSAHLLSANDLVAFSLPPQGKILHFTLDGDPVSAELFVMPGSTLKETSQNHYALSKCETAPQKVVARGVDAAGEQIVGAGSPTLTLRSGDSVHLAVESGRRRNEFILVPPSTLQSATIPNAGTTVVLNAKAKPLHGSLGHTARATIDVTFDDTVCGVFTEYPLPTASSVPSGITLGPDSAVWFAESAGKIGRISTSGTIQETALPTGESPLGITTGSDGALWFTDGGTNAIGRITTAGSVTETSIPTSHSTPFEIANGPDGALWFTEYQGDKIGRLAPGSATIAEYPVPTAGAHPAGITSGPDGALWFTEYSSGKIGRSTVSGGISEFPTGAMVPVGIATGKDGALWFADCDGLIGRITTSGASELFPVSSPGGLPIAITAGPDGAMWFAGCPNSIGRVTTDGSVTTYTVPVADSITFYSGIARGADGALWFTQPSSDRIGRLQ